HMTPHYTKEAAIQDVDIIAVGTSSKVPVLSFPDLRPGVHVTSMGVTPELDASIFMQVDQFVTPSRSQEIANAEPGLPPHHMGGGGPLYPPVQEGRLKAESIVELGSIITSDITPRTGPTDITLLRDSRRRVAALAPASHAS